MLMMIRMTALDAYICGWDHHKENSLIHLMKVEQCKAAASQP